MTTKGEELLQALKGTRHFFGDLSLLLVAGDRLMGERSWVPVDESSCLFGLSYSVSQGQQWMPRVAERQYTSQEHPRIVAMISLILDDYGEDFTLKEPIVSGSYFVISDEVSEDAIWIHHWNAYWFGWRSGSLNGTPITIDQKDPNWKAKWKWRHMQVFGQPLVEINSQQTLQERIVDPLLNLIRSYESSSG